ncbi:potassium transporter [Psychrobacillus psychrodurans]|uniref:Potassium transporter n=1 Tax=Psychrobacillus psychrodurans TaxID=126157 RepID=A0A9X3L878_9BACI|nr:potassium transporter [Psychrobacillus psychrodurans]MCZ8533038.1 potassium transporter [Psychrobacillus psychrodurans]
MNELVSDKKTAYILISALVVVLLGAVYYFVLHPLKNEKESKEVSIEVLQGEVAALKEEYSSSQLQDDSTENAFFLKTQVPLTRELNELIRSIEEVELLSESKILSVEFNNYDGTIEDAQLLLETSEENTETEPKSEDVLTDEPSEEPPVSPVAEASLPEKLKLITFNISILTKNYDQLVMFVEEIEHLKRIYRVDQITLLAPGEEQLLDKKAVNNIAATIQLTTFYHDE